MINIICLVGRSGSGKTTLEEALHLIGFQKQISYTTRPMRENEKDGVDYHFICEHYFERLVEEHIIIEFTKYNEYYYGSEQITKDGHYVIIVEPEGAKNLKDVYGDDIVFIYLKCNPSTSYERLEKRGMDVKTIINRIKVDNERFKDFESFADYTINAEVEFKYVLLRTLSFLRTIRDYAIIQGMDIKSIIRRFRDEAIIFKTNCSKHK